MLSMQQKLIETIYTYLTYLIEESHLCDINNYQELDDLIHTSPMMITELYKQDEIINYLKNNPTLSCKVIETIRQLTFESHIVINKW